MGSNGWTNGADLAGGHQHRHGLAVQIAAGLVCREAEKMHPGMFEAVSVRAGVLTLRCPRTSFLAVKQLEGPLIARLKAFAEPRGLPVPVRIRLTPTEDLIG